MTAGHRLIESPGNKQDSWAATTRGMVLAGKTLVSVTKKERKFGKTGQKDEWRLHSEDSDPAEECSPPCSSTSVEGQIHGEDKHLRKFVLQQII